MTRATRLVDQAEFHQLARARRASGVGVMRPTARVQNIDAGERTVRFCFSDGSIDRAGDRIDPNGWKLDNYRRSPVVLFAHDANSPPIGRALNVHSDGTRLIGDVQFAPAGIYELADTVYGLVRAGFIRAGSVGFLPLEFRLSEDKSRGGGIDFKRQELLEYSVVPVPCNANALIEAAHKGINIAPLRRWVLDGSRGTSRFPSRVILAALSKRLLLSEAIRLYPALATPEGARAWVAALASRGSD